MIEAGVTAGTWTVDLDGTRLEFGPGQLERVGELTRALGGSRVLLVTDSGLRRAGHVDRALASLRDSGVDPVVHDAVEENPTTSHVAHAVRTARNHPAGPIEGIVALGGGSVMDCAKGVNFLFTNGGRMEDYQGRGKATRPMLPALAVPTTAGTGSEAQCYALISQEGSGVKMACGDPKARFRTVILDPDLLRTVPARVAAVTGMDAVSHAVESFVSRDANPISRIFSLKAWSLLERGFEAAVRDADTGPRGDSARAEMLLGAHLAGAAIEKSMLGAAHACANPLTARFGITHGIAVGLMLPHVVDYNAQSTGDAFDELARACGLQRTAEFVDRLIDLRQAAGLPGRLRDCDVPEDDLEELSSQAAGQWTAGFNPRAVTAEDLHALYRAAY